MVGRTSPSPAVPSNARRAAWSLSWSYHFVGVVIVMALLYFVDVTTTYYFHVQSLTTFPILLPNDVNNISSSSASSNVSPYQDQATAAAIESGALQQERRRRKLLEDKKKDTGNSNNNEKKEKENVADAYYDSKDPRLDLFQISNDIAVLGPTEFPKPTWLIQNTLEQQQQQQSSQEVTVIEVEPILKPVLGQHRPDQDAVFLFASEYDVKVHQRFILSLRKTGFQGDIVVAISPTDLASEGEKPIPRQQRLYDFFVSDPHVIVYQVPFICYHAFGGQTTTSSKGGIRTCHCHVLYGTRNTTTTQHNNNEATTTTALKKKKKKKKKKRNGQEEEEEAEEEWQPLQDFRTHRPVATARYELYWIWSIQYQPHTWQMIIDARDTYFQTNPFDHVPRVQQEQEEDNMNDGVLFFFGENSDATRIGKSDKNRKWIDTAYGQQGINALQNKPTICSGASMGEQIALETYLRAMVNEYDESQIKLMGADQGFHNYLYYSGKLRQANKIRAIHVFDQGRGIVNNLGAMRIKPVDQWGNGKMVVPNDSGGNFVLNWDGIISPVVHQFDRFKLGFEGKGKVLSAEWDNEQKNKKNKKKK